MGTRRIVRTWLTTGSTGAVSHGSQLTPLLVGPWALQGVAQGSEVLRQLSGAQVSQRITTGTDGGFPSWVPNATYVYNNNPSNHGGIVPAGGLVIDGQFVKAGTWVAQFFDCSAGGAIVEGDQSGSYPAWSGMMFRGCRMRSGYGAPGFLNQNGFSCGGTIWFSYCDAGAKSLAFADSCEAIFESPGYDRTRDKMFLIRNYLTRASSLSFGRNHGDGFIENWCDEVSDFGDHSRHLNGLVNSGGQIATLWLRNHMVMAQQAGSTNLTDIIQMAADDGPYLGSGLNIDGSTGYVIKDNYLGGANYTLQLGYDKANTVDQVRDVHVLGNLFTTAIYPTSGGSGYCYKTPDFTNTLGGGGQGNEWGGNYWADGPNAGLAVAAPPASNA